MTRGGWLDRYRDGEREQVWWELRQLGAAVREPRFEAEARDVCDEMARRARSNVEILVARLTAQGFRFHSNDADAAPVVPLRPPGDEITELVAALEGEYGPIPFVVSSWMRIVGDVWLVGTHPEWPDSDHADPLVVELEGSRYQGYSTLDYWASEREAWQEESLDAVGSPGFVLPVAPDRLHKANISGGAPYGFRVPDGCADGLFVTDHVGSFVSYLNLVFAHGGFRGFSDGAGVAKIKRALSQGLLEL